MSSIAPREAIAPRFYFVEEVATEIRRSVAATRWLIQTGALKSSKVGGRRVVTPAQLAEFFQDEG